MRAKEKKGESLLWYFYNKGNNNKCYYVREQHNYLIRKRFPFLKGYRNCAVAQILLGGFSFNKRNPSELGHTWSILPRKHTLVID
jgi:hypothetical protein